MTTPGRAESALSRPSLRRTGPDTDRMPRLSARARRARNNLKHSHWEHLPLTGRSMFPVTLPLRIVLMMKSVAPRALAWIDALCELTR